MQLLPQEHDAASFAVTSVTLRMEELLIWWKHYYVLLFKESLFFAYL